MSVKSSLLSESAADLSVCFFDVTSFDVFQ